MKKPLVISFFLSFRLFFSPGICESADLNVNCETKYFNYNNNTEKANLTEKVAIASQLDATGISIAPQNKRGKKAKKVKDVRRFVVNFTITKNITAATGNRQVYVRLLQPTNSVVNASGSFDYENRSLQYSATKVIEYTGEEQAVTLYIPVNETLGKGQYRVDIFVDNNNVGTGTLLMEK